MTEETKTLLDLISSFKRIAPNLDVIAEKIIKENPDTVDIKNELHIGKIVGIFTLDFLMYAYGKGDRGFIRKFSKP